MTILRHLSADKKILLKQHKILRHTIECGISNVGTLHVAVILDMLRRKRGSEVGNKLWLGLLIAAYALPLSAGIYMGTDATPPATYQSDSNYPANVVAANNTAGQRNCRLYYDGKGPVPPLTCSPVTTPSVAASAPTVKTTTAPTPIVPIKNDQAAKQQPLAHVDTTTDNTVCREREVKGQKVSLYFLERKNDRFEKKNMTIQWMNYPHVIILCYDVSNRESFENIKRYQQEIERYTPKKKVKAKIILVANKIDLGARAVSREEGENLASQLKFGRYLEISAKTSQQVKVVALAAAELGLEVMAELANSVVSSSHPSSFSRLTFGNK